MYIFSILKRGGMTRHSPVVDYDPKQTNMIAILNSVLDIYCSTKVTILPGGNVYSKPLFVKVTAAPCSAFFNEVVT
jgi:hypothetical protein